jgi:transcription-repair coupling factor (superfamily II helicase)
MYSRLLKEEVADLTGEPIEEQVDIKLELPVDAHLPHDYVADATQRLELYKRISAVRDAAGVKDVRAELLDRFGALPEPAERLLTLTALKAALRRWNVTEVVVTPGTARPPELRIAPVQLTSSQEVRLDRLHPRHRYNAERGTLLIPVPRPKPDDLVAWVAGTLRDVFAAPKR